MTFARSWVLLVACLPLVWAWWEWRRSGRRGALLLKAGALMAILLALAEPVLTIQETKVAVAILADTSASIPVQDLERASRIADRIEDSRGRHWTRVIPFARGARKLADSERGRTLKLKPTAGDAGRGTNLETAVREAAGALPAGMVPRIALISDGNENMGSVVRAAWQARQLGIPIDTFPLGGRARPSLKVESLSLPSRVFAGERFPIDVTLAAPSKASATVELTAEGKTLGSSRIELEPGLNRFRAHAAVSSVGAVDLAGKITAPGLGETRFEQALTLRRPQVLLVSQDPAEAERHLAEVFKQNQFDVRRSPDGVPDDLGEFQLIAINNWDAEQIPVTRKLAVEEFVKQGGGLAWIGGERNVYTEKKGPEDPLERTLPAKLAPPRTPEGTCVVLIIDKSSSMEGKKMELARLAAIGVIENLKATDLIGVLIFDNSFQWTVPIRKAVDRPLIKRLVAGITPDGGTQIAPALSEAYKRILPVNAVYKHIVLLTDGISEEGDSVSLSREAAQNRVTISTVGLGQDVNRAYLEKVASFSKGKSYFLNDPSGLEQILLRDVMEHTGSTAVEKPVKPVVLKQAEVLEGTGVEAAPALRGYVKFIAKPSSETLLDFDNGKAQERDPLLVRWQYGLGRALVFTSDAKTRWAAEWVNWPGYDKLWTNLVRDLLPHAEASEVEAQYDSTNDELVVDYRLGRGVPDPRELPDVFVLGPNEFRKPVRLAKLAARAYRGRVVIGGRQGLFRVRPLADSRAFPEIGFYRQEAELGEFGSNEFLLRQVSASTGGKYNPEPESIFDAAGRSVPSTLELWPGLLGLAILLNLVELILRKGKGVLEAIRGREEPPARAA